ncbi:MAG: gamma-glutamyltransferase family protein, partial [candidate division NC10 bacterium]|nr:gamma-glutamyltransferase family protein [candidate division NC10 bacterium]
QDEESRRIFLPQGSPPQPGQILRQADLARSLRLIATSGPDAFYHGALAEAISRFCEEQGGLLRIEDLASHRSEWVEPIHTSYRGYEVYELPPNTQGLTTLLELNLAENFPLVSLGHNSSPYIHLLAEIKKLAFADRDAFITDPDFAEIPVKGLLSKEYARRRMGEIDRNRANPRAREGVPLAGDTIYLCAADRDGNLVSLIQSLYFPFGSGVVVKDTGILLQNRGSYFSLREDHVNRLEPVKRTLHTLIPAMVFREGKPFLVFGTMGGEGQPQTQLQILCNLIDFGMNVKEAISAPRWLMGPRSQGEPQTLHLEGGIAEEVGRELEAKGHTVRREPPLAEFFGHAHAICVDERRGIYQGASDPRSDGCAIAW